MRSPVIVIIGAGASHVSGQYAPDDRPPLTRELFSSGRAKALLRIYTLAQAADSVIEREMAADTTIAFEAALRRIQNDGFAHHVQMALAIPPFLQALLLEYSRELRADASRYGVLVDELLKLTTNVHFVSLNYDLLLDNKLAAFSPLLSLDDYINTPLGWSLIKPHGSVAWYVDQPNAFDPKAPPGDLIVVRAPIECTPTTEFQLQNIRASAPDDPHGMASRYPAIALPDGPKDELVLPIEHREFFRCMLAQTQEIHLLVLGYSALDTEVLGLIKGGNCKIRRLTVVNAGAESALEVFNRIQSFGIEPIWADVFDGSFEDWVDGPGLRAWVAEYDGPFSSIIEPAELQHRVDERAAAAMASDRASEPSILNMPL